jgi:2-methylcitrate dehydratase PrpD
VFEGPFGYFALYCETPTPAVEELTRDLGERFEGVNVSIKPYPSCRGTHGPINAVLEILRRSPLAAEDVEEVVVRTPMNETGIFKNIGRPFVLRPDPHVDAQYSIPYTVAAAIVRRDMFLSELEADVIRTPRILDLSDRVHVTIDQPISHSKALVPVEVGIVMKDGRSYSQRIEYMKGHPMNPLTWDDVVTKFHKCVAYAQQPGVERQADRVVEMVSQLERIPHMGELAQLIAGD